MTLLQAALTGKPQTRLNSRDGRAAAIVLLSMGGLVSPDLLEQVSGLLRRKSQVWHVMPVFSEFDVVAFVTSKSRRSLADILYQLEYHIFSWKAGGKKHVKPADAIAVYPLEPEAELQEVQTAPSSVVEAFVVVRGERQGLVDAVHQKLVEVEREESCLAALACLSQEAIILRIRSKDIFELGLVILGAIHSAQGVDSTMTMIMIPANANELQRTRRRRPDRSNMPRDIRDKILLGLYHCKHRHGGYDRQELCEEAGVRDDAVSRFFRGNPASEFFDFKRMEEAQDAGRKPLFLTAKGVARMHELAGQYESAL